MGESTVGMSLLLCLTLETELTEESVKAGFGSFGSAWAADEDVPEDFQTAWSEMLAGDLVDLDLVMDEPV